MAGASKDDKTLTSWNGLMIALARAAVLVKITAGGGKAVEFIMQKLKADGRQAAILFRDGRQPIRLIWTTMLLVWGLWELYEADFTPPPGTGLALTRQMIDLFWDAENGGFIFGKIPSSISRPKEVYDGALPSGNSVAYWTCRLAADRRWELMEIAEANKHSLEVLGNTRGVIRTF